MARAADIIVQVYTLVITDYYLHGLNRGMHELSTGIHLQSHSADLLEEKPLG